jgi:putative tryptophan/tyrosine transport system substrate-binding protein
MRRRDFIAALCNAALPWALSARAQPRRLVIGFLGGGSADGWSSRLLAFRQGLSEIGYVEGHNVAIEYRWAEGRYDRLPELAADLVTQQVAVIVAPGSVNAALAAKAKTTTIPIVFQVGGDPVKVGLVNNLGRPESNVTGVTSLAGDLVPKELELLHQLVPTATVVALLVNPTRTDANSTTKEVEAAARPLGIQLRVLNASTESELDKAFATLAQLQALGLVISADTFFTTRLERLASLAIRHAMPAVYHFREFAAAGGLISYGAGFAESFRQAGIYTGRILKGEKPIDLPVQQVTKVELIINLRTAKALGLTVPPSLLARADEVIE